MGKSTELGMSIYSQKARIILIKMAGKQQHMDPMWKKLMRNVDLDEPTSFLDHVYLGSTQRECNPNEIFVEQYKEMFESRMSAGAQGGKNLTLKQLRGLTTWKNMLKHVWRDIASWQTKKTQQLYKVSTPCIDDHHFKKEEPESVRQLSEVCSQIVLKSLYLARIGRPDILRSVNKLARSVTKWTQACDGRIGKIDFVHSQHK